MSKQRIRQKEIGHAYMASGRSTGKTEIERALRCFSSVRSADSYRFQLDFAKVMQHEGMITMSRPSLTWSGNEGEDSVNCAS